MSIPKEPRQLMINIMYLVLTALLALNVSAEIFNAFKIVDKGLIKSNKSLDQANNPLPELIKAGAKKKKSLAKYAEKIDPARQYSAELDDYIQGIIDEMITQTGGFKADKETGAVTDDLKGKKNNDITTRWLVQEGRGEELKAKLIDYKEKYLALVDEEDRATFEKEIAINVDDETWKENGKASWSAMNFDRMPLQATIPIFRKFQNDAKSTESSMLNYLANKVGTDTEVVFDKYTVNSAPEKSYIIKGEKYSSEIFLSAFAGGDSQTGISISVDGRKLPVNKEGVATYSASANSVGKKSYNASITVSNPATGEVKTYKKTYEYEVGERSVSVSADKMNVFYIGVDNPISVSAAGVNSTEVKVSMGGSGGGSVSKNGDGTYTVRATTPTRKGEFAKVNISAPGMSDSKLFRVKSIPPPVPKIGNKRGGQMGNGEFKVYSSIIPVLEGFDFDAKCSIAGFKLYYAPKRGDASTTVNPGGKYKSDTQRLVDQAKPGDRYWFDAIKCNCPGWKGPRDIGSITVQIK